MLHTFCLAQDQDLMLGLSLSEDTYSNMQGTFELGTAALGKIALVMVLSISNLTIHHAQKRAR